MLLIGLAAGLRAAEPGLTIIGPARSLTLTAAEFAALPHTECAVADPHSGRPLRYSGVAVRDLLARVDAPIGPRLRGPALQLAVIVRARDGYGVIFALAEFDDAFCNRTIVLADQEDGKPLPATSAPFQLVAPGDKRAGRWARMVTTLEIVGIGTTTATPPARP